MSEDVTCPEIQQRLDDAMRALAWHDGRSWCAVCGFVHRECAAKTPECLGARARREFGCAHCEPCQRGKPADCLKRAFDTQILGSEGRSTSDRHGRLLIEGSQVRIVVPGCGVNDDWIGGVGRVTHLPPSPSKTHYKYDLRLSSEGEGAFDGRTIPADHVERIDEAGEPG